MLLFVCMTACVVLPVVSRTGVGVLECREAVQRKRRALAVVVFVLRVRLGGVVSGTCLAKVSGKGPIVCG